MGESMDEMDVNATLNLETEFHSAGKLEEALQYCYKSLMFIDGEHYQKRADILLEIGDIYIEMGKLKKAQENYEKSLKLYNQIKDRVGIGYSLTGLGTISENYKRYKEARKYYLKSIKNFKKAGDYKRAGMVSKLIANIYEMQNDFENALVYYNKSQKLLRKITDHTLESEINKKIDILESKQPKFCSYKKYIFPLFIYLTVLAISEIINAYYSVEIGLLIDTSMIFALLVHSSLIEDKDFSNILRSMITLPMIRIIGLSIPLMQVQTLYWFPVIAIPLFASSFTLARIQKIKRKELGLTWGNLTRGNILVQLVIASTGILLGFIEYEILGVKPLIYSFDPSMIIFAGIILIISTGFAEELIFRGILQNNVQKVFGPAFALLYVSLLFTSLHTGWKSSADMVFVFLVSLFYGFMFQRTKSLYGITLSHGISNSVLFLIMPFIQF
jgi:membrane protease YdiL (CAAX protease family)